jgi:hypothetical protein
LSSNNLHGGSEMRVHHVKVSGKVQEVTVWQRSKSLYVASGQYLNRSVEVTGPSDGQAIKAWIEAARLPGNGSQSHSAESP